MQPNAPVIPGLIPDEVVKTKEELDPFYIEGMEDPRKYDWKSAFMTVVKQVRSGKHPYVPFDAKKSAGLFAYCRDLELEVKALKDKPGSAESLDQLSKTNVELGKMLVEVKECARKSREESEAAKSTVETKSGEIEKLTEELAEAKVRIETVEKELEEALELATASQKPDKLTPQQKAAETRKKNQEKKDGKA